MLLSKTVPVLALCLWGPIRICAILYGFRAFSIKRHCYGTMSIHAVTDKMEGRFQRSCSMSKIIPESLLVYRLLKEL